MTDLTHIIKLTGAPSNDNQEALLTNDEGHHEERAAGPKRTPTLHALTHLLCAPARAHNDSGAHDHNPAEGGAEEEEGERISQAEARPIGEPLCPPPPLLSPSPLGPRSAERGAWRAQLIC